MRHKDKIKNSIAHSGLKSVPPNNGSRKMQILTLC